MNNNSIKDKFNIIGRCYVKDNSVGSEILSFVPDVPAEMYLDDLLIIFTVPNDDQKFSPAFIRLQDKSKIRNYQPREALPEFKEVREVGYLKERGGDGDRGDLIICAPRTHVKVDLNKLVFIATLPSEGKLMAPIYIREKKYEKSKTELSAPTLDDAVIPLDQMDDNPIIEISA